MTAYNILFAFFLLFLCFSTSMTAQKPAYDINAFKALKTSEERLAFINIDTFNKMKDEVRRPLFRQIYPILVEKNDLPCLFFWHFLTYFIDKDLSLTQEEVEEGIKFMWQKGEQEGYPVEAIVGHYWYHFKQFNDHKISVEQFYPMVLHDFEQMERLGFDRFKRYVLPSILFNMGEFMYKIDDVDIAFRYLTVAERFAQPIPADDFHYTLILNYLEDYHTKKGHYEQALAYDQKVYDFHNALPQTERTHTWKGLCLLNMASLSVKMGQPQEAESYSAQGYELCKVKPNEFIMHSHRIWAEFEGLNVLIGTKLKLGKTAEAQSLLQRSEMLSKYLDFEGINYFKPLIWYQNYIAFYEATNNIPKAYHYMKLAKNMDDSLRRRNDVHAIEKVKLRIDAEKYNAQLDLKNTEIAFANRFRWLLLSGLCLLSVFVVALWRQYRKKNKANRALNTSNEKLATLMKELHHRVKNNLQIVSSLLNIQSFRLTDANAAQAVRDSKQRVDAMSLIHQSLYQNDDVSTLDIKAYITNLCESLMSAYGYSHDNFDLTINVPQTQLSVDSAIPIGLILNELVTNSFKYAFKNVQKPALTIGFNLDNEPTLDVIDNGKTFSNVEWERPSLSFGKQLINSLTQQISGQLKLNTEGGQTHFQIVLPQLLPSF
jgi:two-component sensor histidine kinase